ALTLFIINTLTDNARKYTPAGGIVEIKAEQTDQYVEISVKDTGFGLSERDVHRILEEKVYDSSQIGMQNENAAKDELRKNKGFGFGLMNCKGIIDKYRKTNALFNVCHFGIDSELGKGSRFYFRLPKGTLRFFVLLLMIFQGLEAWSQTTVEDEFLRDASRFADSTYYCNVSGKYDQALLYADSACLYLNRYYKTIQPEDGRLMNMTDSDGLAELDWWNDRVVIDYHIILDIRNEAAVASLATRQWKRYKVNNQGYTRLYKLLAEDNSLESFCRSSERAASNRYLAIWLIAILSIGFLVAYYFLYFRHAQLFRMNMEQALLANQRILDLTRVEHAGEVLRKIFPDLNDIHPVKGLALRIDDRDKNIYPAVASQPALLTPLLESQLARVAQTMQAECDEQNGTRIQPLLVELGGESIGVGAFAFIQPSADYTAQDRILNDLILRYLAIMIYQTLIRLTMKQNDVELAEDEKRRTIYEENQLHVQNQMLDNCLSSLKHETMYYPNRIRQMAEVLAKRQGDVDEHEHIHTMRELMDFYKEVFTLLSSCASRQVVDVKLHRTKVDVQLLLRHMERYFDKRMRQTPLPLTLKTECVGCCSVVGDEHLLRFLMESVVDAAFQQNGSDEGSILTLTVKEEGDYVRFTFTDKRGVYTQDYLNTLFYPDLHRMLSDESGKLKGIHYLLAKQI
ncbi:MAG: DUF5113 domain-containing protein, partial [Bacteroidaceae bacterium]|nr:DUF5113 domain-containing protein [Bacteroidaceae bacterium]